MKTVIHQSVIPCSVESLAKFHESTEALSELTPPGQKVTILTPNPIVEEGAIHELEVKMLGKTQVWQVELSQVSSAGFTDKQLKGPFKHWQHRHSFEAICDGSKLTDTISFETGKGALVDSLFTSVLKLYFIYRHIKTRQLIKRRL